MIPSQLPAIANISFGSISSSVAANSGALSAFTEKLKQVDVQLKKTSSLRESYQKGDPDVTLAQVMVEAQKSSLAMAMTVELRNKGIQAYKDLINMPV